MKKVLFLTCILSGSVTALLAQNLKLSQYRNAPMFYNPASTGKFKGKVRAATLFSNQKTDSSALSHVLAFADFKNSEYSANWGFGVSYYQNFNPEFALTGKFFSGSIARHIFLDEDQVHMLSFGGQLTLASGKVDPVKPRYEEMISGGGFKIVGTPENRTASYTDLNFGMMYTYQSSAVTLEAGVAAYHALAPSYQINKTVTYVPRRLVLSLNANITVNDDNEIQLSSLMWREGLRYEVTKPTLIENIYGITVESFTNETTALYYGLSTRSGYSLAPLFGVSLGNNRVKLMSSYEIPFNKTSYGVKRAELSAMITL